MDVQTGLVCVALVLLSGALLLFITMFGTQEKTYEEAIAEQRKKSNDCLLLGKAKKYKSKVKKQLRQGKKVKQKLNKSKVNSKQNKNVSLPENNFKVAHCDTVPNHTTSSPGSEISNKIKSINQNAKKNKKEKVKSIMVNSVNPDFLKNQKNLISNNHVDKMPATKKSVKVANNKHGANFNNSAITQANSKKSNLVKELKNKEKPAVKKSTEELKFNVEGENLTRKKKKIVSMNNKNYVNGIEKIKNEEVNAEKLKQNKNKNKKTENDGIESHKSKKEKIENHKLKNEKIENQKSKNEKTENQKSKNEKTENQKSTNEKTEYQKSKNEKTENQKSKNEKTENQKSKNEKTENQKSKNEKNKSENNKREKMEIGKVKNDKKQNNKMENDKSKDDKIKRNSQQKSEHAKCQLLFQQVKSEENHISSNSFINKTSLPVKKHQLQNKMKNKKNRENDLFFLQQMAEKDGINVSLLISLIQKAELSRNEVQLLTDILLTKHLDEVSDQFEWIEGRQDPVVKLKKQLAEKEKALIEEQEASQAFQNKLKELRLEYNSERARLSQACRQYEESILAKQAEIQNLHTTNRHLIDSNVAEKQALTQKIQQLQVQINDENLVIRKLREDHNQTQNALQQELVNQRQKMEIHIGRLSEQLQETQKNFDAQIHSKIQEAEQIRGSFNAEVQKNRRHEDELRELREQQVQNQNKIKNLELKAAHVKENANYKQELTRQIEELQRVNKDLETRYNNSRQMEEELRYEKTKLQSELHSFTNKVLELQNNCEKLLKERDKLGAQILAKIELEKDVARLKEENQCLISQVSSFTQVEREAQQLREENETLAAQVVAFMERPAADGRENCDSSYNEEKNTNNLEFIDNESQKQNNIVVEHLASEVEAKELLIEKFKSEAEECQTKMDHLLSENARYKTQVSELVHELDEQKCKNNVSLQHEREAFKSLLKRIFPDVKVNEKTHRDWLEKFEESAHNYLEELKSIAEVSTSTPSDRGYLEDLENKNSHLQTLVVHYKKIIEDTEGMLNKLQNHVEQEEIRWRQQCEVLEPQIQILKDKLAEAENINKTLESKLKVLEEKNNANESVIDSEELNEKESGKSAKLSMEVKSLNIKLTEERNKNIELNKEMATLRNTVKFEQDAHLEEIKKRTELEDKLKLLQNKKIKDVPINSSGDFVAFEKIRTRNGVESRNKNMKGS